MAGEKKPEEKVEGKEYIVPLRRKFLKTPRHKRVPKAIKALKKFVARHMKIRDGDLKKIKLDKSLNEEMWFRGIKKPPAKIKIKVKKDGEVIRVELAELSEKARWKKKKEMELKQTAEKVKAKKKAEEEARKKAEEVKKTAETEREEKEKEEKKASVKEAGLKQAEAKAKEIKHEVKQEKGPKRQIRKSLKK